MVSMLPILAYQKIYFDFFSNSQWEKHLAYAYNVDYWQGTSYVSLYADMLKMRYANYPKDSTGNGMKDGRGGKWKNAALVQGYSHHNDNMPHDEYVAWQRACLTEMMRVIKSDGAIFYNHKWRVQNGLLQDRQDIVSGIPVRQIIIWRRKGGINFNKGYFLPTYEVVYLIAKPKFKLVEKANAVGDVWEFTQEMNNPHPAPFPIAFAERCIASTSAQVILDPFMGSGTVALVSKRLKRNFIGIDISPQYCQYAEQRIAEDTHQLSLEIT